MKEEEKKRSFSLVKRRRQLITVHWFPRLNDMNHRHNDDTKLSKPKGAIKGELTNKKERENSLSYFFLLQGRMVLLSSTAVVVTWGFLCVVFENSAPVGGWQRDSEGERESVCVRARFSEERERVSASLSLEIGSIIPRRPCRRTGFPAGSSWF